MNSAFLLSGTLLININVAYDFVLQNRDKESVNEPNYPE